MSKTDPSVQKWLLACGVTVLAAGLYWVVYWITGGTPSFRWGRFMHAGWGAGFVIISLCMLGLGLIVSSIRNLRSHR